MHTKIHLYQEEEEEEEEAVDMSVDRISNGIHM
jgi:hypothetical protein